MKRLMSLVLIAACTVGEEAKPQLVDESEPSAGEVQLAIPVRDQRYRIIRDAANARGVRNAYLLAGIANDETNLAMCWSEATWACKGPGSPDCAGGPIIAGSADGACSAQQGGLGMFQFDAGTYQQTINKYGPSVLTVDGQTAAAIDYVVWMVKVSAYTTNAETDAKARDWINRFDPNNAALRDQWIKTTVRYYNGCQPGWSCWGPRYQTYLDGYNHAISEPGGLDFWADGGGTTCGNSPVVSGDIDKKYRVLGGCGSVLGAPITEERGSPDNLGRYSVFEHGSIYWTPAVGAFEVHGTIRDTWKDTGWETGVLGYPITDETPTPDGGRFNVFERGSIYWSAATGAHEVHGRIRDKWKETGWEAGPLGYPTSNEYAVAGGQRADFQHGSITWTQATDTTTVTQGTSP